MAQTLDFIQIYYNGEGATKMEVQIEQLYPFAKRFFNGGLTPYFENGIIAGLVPVLGADYISVCSWRLRKKRGEGYAPMLIKEPLTEEKILENDFDVAILTPHSPSHKPLAMAVNWHGKAWSDAFTAFKPFLSQFGRIPDELKYAIYENHFITRGNIYKQYVGQALIPAICFMDNRPDIFLQDSGYVSKKRDQGEIKRVQTLLKRQDWPIAPFILERLFSFYINNKGFKVINL